MDRSARGFWRRLAGLPLRATGVCTVGLSLAGVSPLSRPAAAADIQPGLLTEPRALSPDNARPLDGLGVGCASPGRAVIPAEGGAAAAPVMASSTPADPPAQAEGEVLPAPAPFAAPPAAPPEVLIGIDTVFRLAEQQNPKVGVARQRVEEAFAEKDVAATKWLPDLYAGAAYYRHEGGIQNEDGTLTHSSMGAVFGGLELKSVLDLRDVAYQQVNAQREVWQQKGELSRVTSETLLDASTTYIDLLAARTGEVIAREMEQELRELLDRTEKLASVEPGARVEVARVRAEVAGQVRTVLHTREQGEEASAKLIYLLGLDPCAHLKPIDSRLLPFDLIDADRPACDLVAQALQTGPGVREMEGLLSLIQESIAKAQGPGKYVPVFQACVGEGAFGAGPGDSLSWDNRMDLSVGVRWNLTEYLTARKRQRAAQAKVMEAQLSYQDLRGRLTAGVQGSREGVLSGREQIRFAREQIEQARRALDLSKERLKNNVPGSSPSEVLLALDSLGRAQLNYLTTTSEYDKAQLRLMVLLGPAAVLPCQHAAAATEAPELPISPPDGK